VTTLLLDTHVIHWMSSEPEHLSEPAAKAIREASGLAVAAISWWELAYLAKRERIAIALPIPRWLERMADCVTTIGITPAIAATAAELPRSFPGDPADRLIYATAIETGFTLTTRDARMRAHSHLRSPAIW
jgi:PIN domain nuclease of toxin-antitoxin system